MPTRERDLSPSDVLRLYRSAPFSVRLHVAVRWRLFPFPALLRLAPSRGTLLDLGCGHSLLAFCLALRYPAAQVWGVDPDPGRIRLARAITRSHAVANVHFEEGLAEETSLPEACALVSLVDVLYLIPPESQDRLVQRAARSLQPGGRLLLKEMGRRPRWKYVWNWMQEWLAVRALRITYGQRFYFRPEADWEQMLRGLGLHVQIVRLDAGYPYPHLLLVGERPVC